jgi:hypothetical protein
MSSAENSSGKTKRVFPERERRAEIADLRIFSFNGSDLSFLGYLVRL